MLKQISQEDQEVITLCEPSVPSTAFFGFLVSLLGEVRTGLGVEPLVSNGWDEITVFIAFIALSVLTGTDVCHFT